MDFQTTAIPDMLLIDTRVFQDERGFFMETYQKRKFTEAGIAYEFVQDNHSRSRQGVLRGLHYQVTQPQGKLVRVLSGEVFDVAVDLRRSSPTYQRWVGVTLSSENRRQLWIPPGFAHGFYVLSEWADVYYKVTDFWKPDAERTLKWDDPVLAIRWPLIGGLALVSDKDRQGRSMTDILHGEPEIAPVYL